MPGELIGIVVMAALFAVFGFFRLADRGETGCGGCSHAAECESAKVRKCESAKVNCDNRGVAR